MYKIAAIGDQESVLAFEAFGLLAVPCDSPQAAAKAMRKIADECAVIFLTEQLAAQMPAEIAKYEERVTPAVILIPSVKGSLGIGMNAISSAVERAVGVNVFADSEDA